MPMVLIVDDDLCMRTLLKEALENLEDQGVELLTAENGVEAIASIKEGKPELVILDVMMPGMNGFEVCDIVKNKLGMKDTYTMMLTADGQEFNNLHNPLPSASRIMCLSYFLSNRISVRYPQKIPVGSSSISVKILCIFFVGFIS